MKPEEIISKLERRKLQSLLLRGERIDGRKTMEYRPIEIETNIISKAEGSAKISLGDTIAIAGVKAEIGIPYPDTPNQGAIIINTEFLPLASPTFEPGPPDENAIEVARVVDRGIRSCQAVNLEKLCILPGRRAWIIYVDIYVLNHAGNLMDAAGIAAIAALLTTKIPKVKVNYETEEITVTDTWLPLPVQNRPIPITFAKIGDVIVVDPSLEEERVQDARITLTIEEQNRICAIQKALSGTFTIKEIFSITKHAIQIAKKIREKLPRKPDIKNIQYVEHIK